MHTRLRRGEEGGVDESARGGQPATVSTSGAIHIDRVRRGERARTPRAWGGDSGTRANSMLEQGWGNLTTCLVSPD